MSIRRLSSGRKKKKTVKKAKIHSKPMRGETVSKSALNTGRGPIKTAYSTTYAEAPQGFTKTFFQKASGKKF